MPFFNPEQVPGEDVEYIPPARPDAALSTWYVYHPQQLNDIQRNAQNAADISGNDQFVDVRYDGGPDCFLIRADPTKHRLLRG